MVITTGHIKRNRLGYLFSLIVVIGLGLASRKFAKYLPVFIADYAGDTLWALMVYIGIGLLRPKIPIMRAALFAIIFAYLIELSQLYHAPWIDAIRHNRLGGLILGYAFLWSDLLCYSIGVAIGTLSEILLYRRVAKHRS